VCREGWIGLGDLGIQTDRDVQVFDVLEEDRLEVTAVNYGEGCVVLFTHYLWSVESI